MPPQEMVDELHNEQGAALRGPGPGVGSGSTPSAAMDAAASEVRTPLDPLRGLAAAASGQQGGSKGSDRGGVSTSLAEEVDKPLLDFDDVLPHIGDFGFYQKCLFLLMIPFAWFVAFVYFSQIFITLVPEGHWCNIPELQDLNQDERYVRHLPQPCRV